MDIFMNLLLIVLIILAFYAFLVSTGTDNFKGINLHLDNMYKNNIDMAKAVLEELKKQGKKCEISRFDRNFPEFIVEGKRYFMSSRVVAMAGIPTQVVQLKRL